MAEQPKPPAKTPRDDRKGDAIKRVVYGRRQGHKLHPRQAKLVEALLPRLRVDVGAEARPADWFSGAFEAYALEIGFGGGEHLASRARAQPDVGFIGCEPFLNGVAKLLIEIDEANLDNIAIYDDDARDVLEALPDHCLAQIYLLYPDPWHKNRHDKRRFISPQNLDQVFRVLRPEGRFMVASDIPSYIDWTLSHIRAHGGFAWHNAAGDRQRAPEGWPGTRYEAKALREGRVPTYLDFIRLDSPTPGKLEADNTDLRRR
jgi:tRNA (guanine-N7-)-methyltransferase